MKTITTASVNRQTLRDKASHYRSLAMQAEDGQFKTALLLIAAEFDLEAEERTPRGPLDTL